MDGRFLLSDYTGLRFPHHITHMHDHPTPHHFPGDGHQIMDDVGPAGRDEAGPSPGAVPPPLLPAQAAAKDGGQ
jgi:hypothetical protein